MLKIRRASLSDCAFLVACAERAYAPYVERIGRKPAPMIADFDALIRAGDVYIAFEPDKSPSGFVVFRKINDHVFLENVAVDPDRKGKGIGRKLIGFVEETARCSGIGSIRLYTNVKMQGNLALYPALGYVETDRRREDGYERVFFRKTLV
ncbi:MAG: GNAT family N-acetyltransferase [Pseudomonadota bacterium]